MLIGQVLVTKGLLRQDQVETALREQARSHHLFGQVLISLGFIQPEEFYPVLAAHLNIPYVDLSSQVISPLLLESGCKDFLCFWQEEGGLCHVAAGDPMDPFVRHKIGLLYPNYKIYLAVPQFLGKLSTSPAFSSVKVEGEEFSPHSFIHQLLAEAYEQGISDIHFVPQEKITLILFRCQGILEEKRTLYLPYWQALNSHLKVKSQVDLAESRRPQDGRLTFQMGEARLDCRLSFFPTAYGESVVLRLLSSKMLTKELSQLGFLPFQEKMLEHVCRQTQGLFLIAGPTGSGKTTTLYSLLQRLSYQGRSIMSVENPIEYKIDGIRQTEVQEGVNTFAGLLRCLLRHDPDIIYISEIRDEETATIALRAALTGHLVFSTIHANNTLLIPQRLKDLGISPQDLGGVLQGVMAQRLVRQKCTCLEDEACLSCGGKGYVGRRVLSEILLVDEDFRTICKNDLCYSALEKWRLQQGPILWEHLQHLYVTQGWTTPQEISRVFGTPFKGGIHAVA